MSDNKKYYYLKLKENFFDSEEMKILESQKNGIEYQNLYLKMCLLSLKSEGSLTFKDYIPYDISMLSTVLRVNIDTVKTGVEIFIKLGLVNQIDTGLIYMSDIQSLIGAGSSEGDRKKRFREKIKKHKEISGGQMSTIRPPELELEKELEKEKQELETPTGDFSPFKKMADKFHVAYMELNKGEKMKFSPKECNHIKNLLKEDSDDFERRFDCLYELCTFDAFYKMTPSCMVNVWNNLTKEHLKLKLNKGKPPKPPVKIMPNVSDLPQGKPMYPMYPKGEI